MLKYTHSQLMIVSIFYEVIKMKYDWETEEQFLQRVKEARKKGQCVFRDDNNREMILDIIDDYIDLIDAIEENNNV